MKTNSELPLALLDSLNEELNDYDFVLYNLYRDNDRYREYFLDMRQREPDRLMILDNSAYELYIKGEELDPMDYLRVINELHPDIFIIPDTLMSKSQTTASLDRWIGDGWINEAWKAGALPLAVAQGSTSIELAECLKEYKETGISCVALPFHNTFFRDMIMDPGILDWMKEALDTEIETDDMLRAAGRVQWIRDNEDLLKSFGYVHLLGSHHPLEKAFYNDLPYIKSMDTSYPVKCALEGYVLFQEPSKPNTVIDDWLEMDISQDTRKLIVYNVQKFKLI